MRGRELNVRLVFRFAAPAIALPHVYTDLEGPKVTRFPKMNRSLEPPKPRGTTYLFRAAGRGRVRGLYRRYHEIDRCPAVPMIMLNCMRDRRFLFWKALRCPKSWPPD